MGVDIRNTSFTQSSFEQIFISTGLIVGGQAALSICENRSGDAYLRQLSLDDNNAVFNLCCRICTAYEHKAFIDGFHYGAQLLKELI